jgi:hypothetical protein
MDRGRRTHHLHLTTTTRPRRAFAGRIVVHGHQGRGSGRRGRQRVTVITPRAARGAAAAGAARGAAPRAGMEIAQAGPGRAAGAFLRAPRPPRRSSCSTACGSTTPTPAPSTSPTCAPTRSGASRSCGDRRARYGSEAIGGVINIIPGAARSVRQARPSWRPARWTAVVCTPPPPGTSGRLTGGSRRARTHDEAWAANPGTGNRSGPAEGTGLGGTVAALAGGGEPS